MKLFNRKCVYRKLLTTEMKNVRRGEKGNIVKDHLGQYHKKGKYFCDRWLIRLIDRFELREELIVISNDCVR